jgi:hypothetical protein
VRCASPPSRSRRRLVSASSRLPSGVDNRMMGMEFLAGMDAGLFLSKSFYDDFPLKSGNKIIICAAKLRLN